MDRIEKLAQFEFNGQDVSFACEMSAKQLEYAEKKLGLEFDIPAVKGRARDYTLPDIWRISLIADLTLGGMTRAASVEVIQRKFDFTDVFWLNRDVDRPSFLVATPFGFRPEAGVNPQYATDLVIGADSVVPLLRSQNGLTANTHIVNVSLRLNWTENDLIIRLKNRGKWSE